MSTPKVSVIIPVYNTQPWLRECLDSVLRQSLEDYEVICVDDGSTDQSGSILQEYAAQDARFQILSQSNQGQSAARNAGLKVARGEYVYFFDSDDYIEPDLLKAACQEMDSKNLDIVFFDTRVFADKGIPQKEVDKRTAYYTMSRDYSAVSTGEDLMRSFLESNDFCCSVCKQVVRRDLLTSYQVFFYEGIINEDELYTFQILLLAGRAAYIHRVFYNRRLRMNSTVTKPLDFQSPYGYFICYKEAYRFLRKQKCNPESVQWFLMLIQSWAKKACKEYAQLKETEQNKVESLLEEDKLLFQLWLADYDSWNRIIRNLEQSRSFRIGRAVTFVPRKLRDWFRCR